MVVPMKLAATTWRIEVGIPVCSPSTLSTLPSLAVFLLPPPILAGVAIPSQAGGLFDADSTGQQTGNESQRRSHIGRILMQDRQDSPRRVFDLEQPRTQGMPIHPAHQQAGYSYLLHRHHEDEYRPEETGPRTGAAGILILSEHTGTHIDALCHQSDALVLYGGVKVDSSVQTPRGFTHLGVEEVPPILAPGVL